MRERTASRQSKLVIDGLAANAFRVIEVGRDIVLESFYLYPNFSDIPLENGNPLAFDLTPDDVDEPNIRLIMNRETATRLANALLTALKS